MPLPSWATDVADYLQETESLVLLEGTFDDQDVLVLAKITEIPNVRVELHPLALILDTSLAEKIEIDPDKTQLYSLTTLEGQEQRADDQRGA